MNLWKERIWSLIEMQFYFQKLLGRDDLAKDEEIAAKKLEDEKEYLNDDYDLDEYEPSDEEILNQNY